MSYIVEVPIDAEVETCDEVHDPRLRRLLHRPYVPHCTQGGYRGSDAEHPLVDREPGRFTARSAVVGTPSSATIWPLQELIIRCDELGLDRRYEPSSDLTVISVRDDVDISEANGEYTIRFTATDLSGNTAEASRTIRILVASKPEIRRQETGSGYASPGGKIRFALQLSTNIEHTLTQATITSSALGINETLSPREQHLSA